METAVMATVALLATALTRRRDIARFHWRPSAGTVVALLGATAIAVFSAGMLLLQDCCGASRFVQYVLLYVTLGMALPLWHTFAREGGTPAALGLTRRRLWLSLGLDVGLGSLVVLLMAFTVDAARFDAASLAKAALVLFVGCTFEAIFYYGYLHLRLDAAFGMLPAILLASALYVLWHAGTQLRYEPDVPAALLKLFCVGVMYQSVFSITRNLAAVWPFFLTAGALIDHTANLDAVPQTAAHLPWALISLALMALTAAWASRASRRQQGGSRASHELHAPTVDTTW